MCLCKSSVFTAIVLLVAVCSCASFHCWPIQVYPNKSINTRSIPNQTPPEPIADRLYEALSLSHIIHCRMTWEPASTVFAGQAMQTPTVHPPATPTIMRFAWLVLKIQCWLYPQCCATPHRGENSASLTTLFRSCHQAAGPGHPAAHTPESSKHCSRLQTYRYFVDWASDPTCPDCRATDHTVATS